MENRIDESPRAAVHLRHRMKRPRGALIACTIAGVATIVFSTYVCGVAWELYTQCNPPAGNSICAYTGPFGLTGAVLLVAAIVGVVAAGLFILLGALVYARPHLHMFGGAMILVTALLTIPVLGGFFIGIIAGFVGGILAIVFVPSDAGPVSEWTPPPASGPVGRTGGRPVMPPRGSRAGRPRPLRPPSPIAPAARPAIGPSTTASGPIYSDTPSDAREFAPPAPVAPVPRTRAAPPRGAAEPSPYPWGTGPVPPVPAVPPPTAPSGPSRPPPWARETASRVRPPPAAPPPLPAPARPPTAPPTAPGGSKRSRVWKCPQCGTTNAPWSEACTNCHTPAPPYVAAGSAPAGTPR
jgi:hypothetical protein